MRGYYAFVKKEWMENIRTYKLLIMLIVFVIFGIMSPFFAKIMPELLKSLSSSEGIVIPIEISEPTMLDSYAQFFKNITQMGMIVLLLVFSGLLSHEISKGTLIPLVTKGLSRTSIILAKFTVAGLLWSLSFMLSFLITELYTIFLFPAMDVYNLFLSISCVWLFGILLLALSMCMACIAKGNYGGLLMSVLCIGIFIFIDIFPHVHQYNPIALVSDNMLMLTKAFALSSILPAILITIAMILLFIIMTILLFKKKKL